MPNPLKRLQALERAAGPRVLWIQSVDMETGEPVGLPTRVQVGGTFDYEAAIRPITEAIAYEEEQAND